MREKLKGKILVLGLVGYWMVGYFLTNHLSTARAGYSLSTPLDTAIPFEPGWLYIYLAIWGVIFSPLAIIKSYHQLKQVVKGYVFSFSVSFTIFLLFPVKMTRPEAVGEGITLWGIRTLYSIDGPGNCFPSIHVAAIFFGALVSLKLNRSFGVFLIVWSFLISLSTLFIKQHYLADIGGGILLAIISYLLFIYRSPLFPKRA